jgi:hypothetical protein
MCLLGKSRIIGTDKQREHTSAAESFLSDHLGLSSEIQMHGKFHGTNSR